MMMTVMIAMVIKVILKRIHRNTSERGPRWADGARFEPPGEPEVGFQGSISAQTPPLVCSVDDDRLLVMTAMMKTVIFKRILRRKSEKSSSLGG